MSFEVPLCSSTAAENPANRSPTQPPGAGLLLFVLYQSLVNRRAGLRRCGAEQVSALRHLLRIIARTATRSTFTPGDAILRQLRARNSCGPAMRPSSPTRNSDSNSRWAPACDTAARPDFRPDSPAQTRRVTLALSARAELATISNGDFTLARYAPSDQNSFELQHGLHHFPNVAIGSRGRSAPFFRPAARADCPRRSAEPVPSK